MSLVNAMKKIKFIIFEKFKTVKMQNIHKKQIPLKLIIIYGKAL